MFDGWHDLTLACQPKISQSTKARKEGNEIPMSK
jgi:hypothetical protein